MACGDPAAYKMTQVEFREAYGDQVKELLKEQMKLSFADAMKGDKSKNEMKEESATRISDKMEELTGLTWDELQTVNTNWDMIQQTQPEGYKDMTIKEILDYK